MTDIKRFKRLSPFEKYQMVVTSPAKKQALIATWLLEVDKKLTKLMKEKA